MPLPAFPTPFPHVGCPPWVVPPPHCPVSVAIPAPLHPLISQESSGSLCLLFDLSSHTFGPQYFTRGCETQLRLDELSAPATYPPIHCIVITCNHLPQWPITIERHIGTTFSAPHHLSDIAAWTDIPITTYDVLAVIYHALHLRVSATDWFNLAPGDQELIVTASRHRCHRAAETRWLDSGVGLRRVDYLHNCHMFRGLICESNQGGVAYVKMVVGKKTSSW